MPTLISSNHFQTCGKTEWVCNNMRKVVHVSKSFYCILKSCLRLFGCLQETTHIFSVGFRSVSWSIKDVNLPTFQKRAHNFRFVALGAVLHENSAFMNVQISSNMSFGNLRYFVPNMVVQEQLCPTQMACWAKNYVTILTRAAQWMT